MILSFVEYAPETGEILRSGSCPAADMHLQGEAVLWVSGAVDDTGWYVQDQALVPRPELGIALDKRSVQAGGVAIFSGIPAGCAVELAGRSVTVDDGELAFSSAAPGRYLVLFRLSPYREQSFLVEVVE